MANLDDVLALSNGAKFYRVDLHIHSHGGSHDVTEKGMIPDAIVSRAINEGLSMVSITDHNEISNVEGAIKAAAGKNVIVIPGIELSTNEGHLLCYFAGLETLRSFHGRLKFKDQGTQNSRCQNSILECLDIVKELNGFGVLAHADGDGGFVTIQGITSPHSIDVICHEALLGIELLSTKSLVSFSSSDPDSDRVNVGKERIKRLGLGEQQFIARLLNSDAHELVRIGQNSEGVGRITRIKMNTPSFDALRIALEDSDARVRIEDDIPQSVPYLVGLVAEGGFLDGFNIHFNPNLNCIIGGRGAGKSTTFEAVRCLISGGNSHPSVDSEIWPNDLHMFWKDQAGATHSLYRPINGSLENALDPQGPTSFNIESYSQGETTRISHETKTNPVALLSYLNRFIDISQYEKDENSARDEMLVISSDIEKAKKHTALIPGIEKDLNTTKGQLKVLAEANANEVIELQRSLEEERASRDSIQDKLNNIDQCLQDSEVVELVDEIENITDLSKLKVGATEFEAIVGESAKYKVEASSDFTAKRAAFAKFKKQIEENLNSWKTKETAILQEIEKKKKELNAAGVTLDLPYIRKLALDEAKLTAQLKSEKTWEKEVFRLEAEYKIALEARWRARDKVSTARIGYAKLVSQKLGAVLKDLTVSLNFESNSYSPEADAQIKVAMSWKTSQVPRASLLISSLTVQGLLNAIDEKDVSAILKVKTPEGTTLFTQQDAEAVIEKLSEPTVKSALERATVFDVPKINLTGMIKAPDGKIKPIIKDFAKLSLGQQQSILLSLMLSSSGNYPLIIDQPEDHLDGEFIYKTLVPVLRQAKERRQIIIVTHNPNIAVLGDAEQIIILKSTNTKSSITGVGSIDEPSIKESTCNVLEGAREAFRRRAKIYGKF